MLIFDTEHGVHVVTSVKRFGELLYEMTDLLKDKKAGDEFVHFHLGEVINETDGTSN